MTQSKLEGLLKIDNESYNLLIEKSFTTLYEDIKSYEGEFED